MPKKPDMSLPLDPQPVLADTTEPGRWVWGPTLPITDMCFGGNAIVSWWNDKKADGVSPSHAPDSLKANYKRIKCVLVDGVWYWQAFGVREW